MNIENELLDTLGTMGSRMEYMDVNSLEFDKTYKHYQELQIALTILRG